MPWLDLCFPGDVPSNLIPGLRRGCRRAYAPAALILALASCVADGEPAELWDATDGHNDAEPPRNDAAYGHTSCPASRPSDLRCRGDLVCRYPWYGCQDPHYAMHIYRCDGGLFQISDETCPSARPASDRDAGILRGCPEEAPAEQRVCIGWSECGPYDLSDAGYGRVYVRCNPSVNRTYYEPWQASDAGDARPEGDADIARDPGPPSTWDAAVSLDAQLGV